MKHFKVVLISSGKILEDKLNLFEKQYGNIKIENMTSCVDRDGSPLVYVIISYERK